MMLISSLTINVPADTRPLKKIPAPNKPIESKMPLKAEFHFYATDQNPKVPAGTYLMSGTFDEQGRKLELKGTSWVQRPANYEMVPLKGKINEDGSKFIGRIQFEGCKEFTLIRISWEGTSPIAGKWQGGYVCSQGVTGLTLTLK